jgi:lipoprotein-anchoring transpeptidase ErfK/SrfK
VPVIAEQDGWSQVLLPTRPNAAAGWVHVVSGEVESAQNDYVINVNREAFSLELVQAGKSIGKWTIGIGKPEHPTPQGRAYIMASIAETVNKYSPIVLPLSYHSDSLETFGGGPGTVGIHTWPNDSFVGKPNSDGCIRVPADALNRLAKVPLGALVNIT